MAPLPENILALLTRSNSLGLAPSEIPGLSVSSLELDSRSTSSETVHLNGRSQDASSATAQAASRVVARAATSTYTPCAGCKSPESFNNSAFFALFAILGVAMALASLWFFFWAKNGGFHFQQGDWDDYKTTVMRRKGPDGKTLSNATKSTKLGGGSVVHGQARWAAKTVVGKDEKGRKGILGKRGFAGTHSMGYSDDFTQFDGNRNDEMSEVASITDRGARHGGHHAQRYRDRDIKKYREERPAKVGGMNRSADGSHFDYSDTQTDLSTDPLVNNTKRAKLERKAETEAAKMEKKWRQEAERAAAAIARERAQQTKPATKTPATKPRTPSPVKKAPSPAKREHRASSRTPSPQKRDYSFSRGADDLSTTDRSSSYYNAYRPHATDSPRHERRNHEQSRSRQASPQKSRRTYDDISDSGTKVYEHHIPGVSKGAKGGRDVMAGYRRGGPGAFEDSDDE